MKREEIKYIEATAEFKGWLKSELYHFALERNLVPEKLAERVFLGGNLGAAEQLSSQPGVQVRVPIGKSVRVQATKRHIRGSKVAHDDHAHGETHSGKVDRRKRPWTEAQRKAQAERMRQRWQAGEFEHKRKQ